MFSLRSTIASSSKAAIRSIPTLLAGPSSRASISTSSSLLASSSDDALSSSPAVSTLVNQTNSTSPTSRPLPTSSSSDSLSASNPFVAPTHALIDKHGNPNLNIRNYVQPSPSLPVLDLLASQPNKYIIAKFNTRKLLLHTLNIVTIPRLKPAPALGTKLEISRIFEAGTRDYALSAPKGSRLTGVKCEATVLEHILGPVDVTNKKKRRKGYKKQIKGQSRYTVLRIGDINIQSTAMAEDEQPKERTLHRQPYTHPDQYSPHDTSTRARVARKYGLMRE